MNSTNQELIKKIILIKEALNPKYIYYERYMQAYDKKAYNLIGKNGLETLLDEYIKKCTHKELLRYFDSPEIRYLYFMSGGFHEAKIFNVEYTKKFLDIYLDGLDALCWPKGVNSKIIIRFFDAKDVYVDKLPSFFDGNEIQLLDNKLFINISSMCKSCSFSFKDVKFYNID